jgi:hypothetical protein
VSTKTPISDDTTASGSSPSTEPNANDITTKKPTPNEKKIDNRVVTLPCSHLFHAACLVTWFSRPKQTTCPSCRFNIYLETLTSCAPCFRTRTQQATQPRNPQSGQQQPQLDGEETATAAEGQADQPGDDEGEGPMEIELGNFIATPIASGTTAFGPPRNATSNANAANGGAPPTPPPLAPLPTNIFADLPVPPASATPEAPQLPYPCVRLKFTTWSAISW